MDAEGVGEREQNTARSERDSQASVDTRIDTPIGRELDTWVVLPVSLVVGLLPLVLLFSFILRIATVSERTAATIPFTTPEQEK